MFHIETLKNVIINIYPEEQGKPPMENKRYILGAENISEHGLVSLFIGVSDKYELVKSNI